MNRAAIDIGSNSLLLTVADADLRPLHDEAVIVGLGKGLGDGGHFRPDRRALAEQVLTRYVQQAAALGVPADQIRAVATSGARRASDAEQMFSELRHRLGLVVRVVSGEEEAELSWSGALGGLSLPPGPGLVIDLGGGSTEVVFGEGPHIHWRRSMEVGTVRLTEAYADDAAALSRRVEEVCAALPNAQPQWAVAVAGTATTLAAMDAGLTRYDGAVVHGRPLSVTGLLAWRDRLRAASPQQRQELAAVAPERADYLPAGAEVIAAVLIRFGLPAAQCSDGGLRWGLLRQVTTA